MTVGLPDRALVRRAILSHPLRPKAYRALALIYQQQQRGRSALAAMRQAVALNPNEAQGWLELGALALEAHQLPEAVAALERAIALDPATAPNAQPPIDRYRAALAAGYAPQLADGWVTWDAMVWRSGDRLWLHYLTGPGDADPFYAVGEWHAAYSDDGGQRWQAIGPITQPWGGWAGGRILAGCVREAAGRFYQFYGGSPPRPRWNHEQIGLAWSADGQTWERSPEPFWASPTEQAQFDRFYKREPHAAVIKQMGEAFCHRRDPFVWHEPRSNRYYLYFTAALQGTHDYFHGGVGLATAEAIAGPYQLQAPAAAPICVAASATEPAASAFYELERPQVLHHNGRYHLFFGCWHHNLHPAWRDRYQPPTSHSTIYWLTADDPAGPFLPAGDRPWVLGSDRTGLYGVQWVDLEGHWYAWGHDILTFTLDLSRRYRLSWVNQQPAIAE